MSTPILEVDQIVKRFGEAYAVQGLTFQIEPGEIFALLGPNGAGKTTTLRMLLGILRPDSGSIRFSIDDEVTATPPAQMLGYLPEDRGLYNEASIVKVLEYMGILRGLSRTESRRAGEEWLERLELSDRADEKITALSKGNQQRVQFAAAILHRPRFAALDEPFSGLDPVHQERFLDMLDELRRQGTTILLSAHQMDLVERAADRYLLMRKGKTSAEGSLEEIRAQSEGQERLRIESEQDLDLETLRNVQGVLECELIEPRLAEITRDPDIPIGALVRELAAACELRGVQTRSPSLHEIFLRQAGLDEDAEDES